MHALCTVASLHSRPERLQLIWHRPHASPSSRSYGAAMRGRKPATIVPGNGPGNLSRAPAWLAKDAKAEWRRVAPILAERKTLTEADLGCLEAYCAAIGLMRAAQREIDEHGLTIGSRKHPAVAIQSDAMTQARQLAAELGLTPVSRSRPAVRDDDAAQDLSWMG